MPYSRVSDPEARQFQIAQCKLIYARNHKCNCTCEIRNSEIFLISDNLNNIKIADENGMRTHYFNVTNTMSKASFRKAFEELDDRLLIKHIPVEKIYNDSTTHKNSVLNQVPFYSITSNLKFNNKTSFEKHSKVSLEDENDSNKKAKGILNLFEKSGFGANTFYPLDDVDTRNNTTIKDLFDASGFGYDRFFPNNSFQDDHDFNEIQKPKKNTQIKYRKQKKTIFNN